MHCLILHKWIKIKESTIVQCVRAKAQDGKMRWIMITKATMGVIFNLQNSYLLNLALPTGFQVDGQNRPVANRKKRYYQSHRILTFGFSFCKLVFFPFSKRLNVNVLEQNGFINVLVAIIWGISDKLPCIENREGFAVHSSTWPSGAKGEWRVSSWLAISNTREKISYFFTCVVAAFLRAGNLFITP